VINSVSVVYRSFSGTTQLSQYHTATILDFIGARMMEVVEVVVTVKLSPPTNQHPTVYRLDALPVTQPTVYEH